MIRRTNICLLLIVALFLAAPGWSEPVTDEEIAGWEVALTATIEEIERLEEKLRPLESELLNKRSELAAVEEDARIFDLHVRKSSSDFKNLQNDRALLGQLLAEDAPFEISYENWRTGRTEKHRRPFKFLREKLNKNIEYLQGELRLRVERMGMENHEATPSEIRSHVLSAYGDYSTRLAKLRGELAELTSRQIELQGSYLEALDRNHVYRSLIEHGGLFVDELLIKDETPAELGAVSTAALLEIHCRFVNKRDVPIHSVTLKLGLRNQRGDLIGYREWSEEVDLQPADSFFFNIEDVPSNAASVHVVEVAVD